MKGGWAILSSFNYGGAVHQYSIILSYMLFISPNCKKWLDCCTNTFDKKKIYIKSLNTIKKIYDESQKHMASFKNVNDDVNDDNIKLLNLIIGSIMPDITLEQKSICLPEEYNFDNPDNNITFSYERAKAIETLSKSKDVNKIADANHGGDLSIQHFMLPPLVYDKIQNDKIQNDKIQNDESKYNEVNTNIKNCIISRIKLAIKWHKAKYHNAAYRMIGHVIHTIQDSFSTYHCSRNEKTLNIEYYYSFTKPENKKTILTWQITHLENDGPLNVISPEFINLYFDYRNFT